MGKENRSLVPRNIRDLTPYQAGKTIAEVQEAYHPPRISKLASNENRLGCSSRVKTVIGKSVNEIQDYPDPIARKLRARIAEQNGVSPHNIIVAGGSESIIAILCRTFFSDQDEIITAGVTFVGIFVHAGIEGINVHRVPITKDYRYDLEAITRRISGRTKMVYIANPNNPTGTYVTKSEFEFFMGSVPDDLLVVIDEAYFEYAEDGEDYPNAMEYDYDNLLVLRTFSKAYGLAGLRIGYGVGSEGLIANMMKTKLTFEPTLLAQEAALAALDDKQFLDRSKKMVERGKRRLYSFLDEREIKYVPSAGNAVLMVMPGEQEAVDFTQAMLEEGVILRRVHAFGLPNGIRITIGTEEEMDHFEQTFENIFVR